MSTKQEVTVLLSDVIATGNGNKAAPWGSKMAFHAFGDTSAGAGAASIEIQVSNDGTNYVVRDTLSLTLATTIGSASQDTFVMDEPFKYVRANVASISGTDATVSLLMSVYRS